MTLKTLEQHEKERARIHTFVESDTPKRNGISCPKCESELYDTNPAITLTSSPAKKYIHCKVCDFKGTRTA